MVVVGAGAPGSVLRVVGLVPVAASRVAVEPAPTRTVLTGVVVDERGKGVAGAEVELLQMRESTRTVSKDDGRFQLPVPDLRRFSFLLLARRP